MTAPADQFWNAQAESYSAKPVGDPEAFDRKTAITRALIEPDHTVLEIGCGTGSLCLRLAPTGAQLHGLDVAAQMIRIARDKAREAAASNAHFHVGPFDDTFTAFEPGALDGVLAYSILHLLPRRQDAIARIFELLRPGGYVVASTVCLAESWVPFSPVIGFMRWIGKAPWVDVKLSKERLHAELRAAGFERLEQPDVGASSIVDFVVAHKPR